MAPGRGRRGRGGGRAQTVERAGREADAARELGLLGRREHHRGRGGASGRRVPDADRHPARAGLAGERLARWWSVSVVRVKPTGAGPVGVGGVTAADAVAAGASSAVARRMGSDFMVLTSVLAGARGCEGGRR